MSEVVAMRSFGERSGDIGPKLRRLAELFAWGYRVPDGFALTCGAIDVMARDGVHGELAAAIAREHAALCRRLGRSDPPLAVRSAATAEDGDRRSFAGMYATVLGVVGLDGIATALHTCIAGKDSARLAGYGDGGSLSVGVQELIAARVSGVAFSRHPTTHRSDRLVIECVLGLGTTMVDGVTQPDHIEVGRADRRVLRHDAGRKAHRAVVVASGDVVEEQVFGIERDAPCTTDDDIARVCDAVVDIEGRIGRAVDIEWAIGPDDELVIVQARPITSGPRASREPIRWDPARYARDPGRRHGE